MLLLLVCTASRCIAPGAACQGLATFCKTGPSPTDHTSNKLRTHTIRTPTLTATTGLCCFDGDAVATPTLCHAAAAAAAAAAVLLLLLPAVHRQAQLNVQACFTQC